MASSNLAGLNTFHKLCHAKAEQQINERWPGGLPAMLAAYRDGQTTLADMTATTGILFRGLRRLLSRHGVPIRDYATASAVAHALKPEWGEHISQTKKIQAFRHPPHVTAQATEKRLRTVRADPSRHGLAHIAMTNRERQFADMLERHGVAYRFNAPAAHYFLDFHLPAIAVGIEVQRSQALPVRERDAVVTQALNLKGIVYVPGWYLRSGLAMEVERLVRFIDRIELAELGDCRYLCTLRGRSHAFHKGFYFMRRWAPPTPLR